MRVCGGAPQRTACRRCTQFLRIADCASFSVIVPSQTIAWSFCSSASFLRGVPLAARRLRPEVLEDRRSRRARSAPGESEHVAVGPIGPHAVASERFVLLRIGQSASPSRRSRPRTSVPCVTFFVLPGVKKAVRQAALRVRRDRDRGGSDQSKHDAHFHHMTAPVGKTARLTGRATDGPGADARNVKNGREIARTDSPARDRYVGPRAACEQFVSDDEF